VRIYFNQSGNSWTDPHSLTQMPATDSLSFRPSVFTGRVIKSRTLTFDCIIHS
jgi:hypothetical protein